MRKQYPESVRRITAIIGGKTYCYRSEGEFMWAQYLEFLKQSGEIADWFYEPSPFYFTDIQFGPVQYKLDFLIKGKSNFIRPGDPDYYQEFKHGEFDGPALTKLRRMAKQYPDVVIELVVAGKRKKDAHRLYVAKKYIKDNRVTDASVIFRQMGGLIKRAKDYQGAKELQDKMKELTNA